MPLDLAGIATSPPNPPQSAAGSYKQVHKMLLWPRAKKWQDYIPQVNANKINIRGEERNADVLNIQQISK